MARFAISLFCGLLLAQAAAAAPLRQPIKGWVLDYGDTACTALRPYGRETAPTTLAFRPSPNGTVVRLIVVRPGGAPEASHFPVTLNIAAPRAKVTALRFEPKETKADIFWINLPRSDLERLPAVRELAIRSDRAIDERFALPGIDKVLKGLDECNADLRKYWNVGGAGVRLSKPATPVRPLAAYFSDRDYPAQAVDENAGGASLVMMMIDESGTLKDCLVEETSGIASLDAMACIALRQRARFKPALDEGGRPVRSVLTQRIVWRMP